jgi:hypothetical protein
MAEDGTLDPAETARLLEWLRTKWKHKGCPVCEADSWTVNPRVGQIYNEGTFRGGTSYPVVLVFCTNCGYTLPINARIAGVKRDEPEDQDPDAPPGVG